jgi:hypothetical protein
MSPHPGDLPRDLMNIPKSREQRQRESAAALADQPRREEQRRADHRDYVAARYAGLLGRLESLGIDPSELRKFLNEPNPR